MIHQITKLVAGATLLAATAFSQAAPVLWSLQGAVFNDGAVATGTFIYDAATDVYSSVSISTTTGNSYVTGDQTAMPFGVSATGIELVEGHVAGSNAGKDILNLDFSSALTDLGGVVALVTGFPSFEGRCSAGDCSSGTILRTVVGGSVVGVAVPEPATLAIAGLGLLGLAATRRRS